MSSRSQTLTNSESRRGKPSLTHDFGGDDLHRSYEGYPPNHNNQMNFSPHYEHQARGFPAHQYSFEEQKSGYTVFSTPRPEEQMPSLMPSNSEHLTYYPAKLKHPKGLPPSNIHGMYPPHSPQLMQAPLSDRAWMSNRGSNFKRNLTLPNLSFYSTEAYDDSFHNSSGNVNEMLASIQTPSSTGFSGHDLNGSGKMDFNGSNKINTQELLQGPFDPSGNSNYDYQSGSNKNRLNTNMTRLYSSGHPNQTLMQSQFQPGHSYRQPMHVESSLNQSCINFQPMHDLNSSFTFGDVQTNTMKNKMYSHPRMNFNMPLNPQSLV